MKRIKYLSLFAAIALGSLFNAPEATAQNKLVDGSFPAIITPHNQTVSYLERTLCFQITANVPFTTTTNSEWISATALSGFGSAIIFPDSCPSIVTVIVPLPL